MLVFLLAVVIEGQAASDAVATTPAPHNYLRAADPCDSRASGDDVVVCGRADLDAQYRLQPPQGTTYAAKPVRAEVKIANGTLGLSAKAGLIGADAQDKIVGRHEPRNEWVRLRFAIPF